MGNRPNDKTAMADVGTNSPVACNLLALDAEERATHMAAAEEILLQAADETTELADGFAFRFPEDRYPAVAAFVAKERRCCPFFAFSLDVSPHAGPISLRITGGLDAKNLLKDLLDR